MPDLHDHPVYLVYFVYLVCLVYSVYLVCLVYSVYLVDWSIWFVWFIEFIGFIEFFELPGSIGLSSARGGSASGLGCLACLVDFVY